MNKAVVASLTTLGLLISVTPCTAAQGTSHKIENALTRAVAQQTAKSPLTAFHEKIQTVTQPAAQPVMEALELLTAYNKTFETEKDTARLRALAAQLEGPIPVPWNTYRGNGLKEIFNNYVPDSHGNKELANLEFYVKFYTLPQETHLLNYLLVKSLPDFFVEAYTQLQTDLSRQTQRNNKEIIASIARFIPAYNRFMQEDTDLAERLQQSDALKKAFFRMPFQTGWDKSMSLDDLMYELGLQSWGGGDYFTHRTAEELQRKFQADAADAELFVPFVKVFY